MNTDTAESPLLCHPRSVLSAGLLLFGAGLSLCSCSTTDYARIPRTPFIEHYQQCKLERIPFSSYWDNITDDEWDKAVRRRRKVYLKPVTQEYFRGGELSAQDAAEIRRLCIYFDRRLREELSKANREDATFILTDTLTPDATIMEVALLSARPVDIGKNTAIAAGEQLVGGGLLWSWLVAEQEEQKGYISMAVRLTDTKGKVLAEMADFEYGMKSLPGRLSVDTKDFRPYAYQRRTIDYWAEELGKLSITDSHHEVHRPLFSLNPF